MVAACFFFKRKKRNPIPDRRHPQQPTGYAILVGLPLLPGKRVTRRKGKNYVQQTKGRYILTYTKSNLPFTVQQHGRAEGK